MNRTPGKILIDSERSTQASFTATRQQIRQHAASNKRQEPRPVDGLNQCKARHTAESRTGLYFFVCLLLILCGSLCVCYRFTMLYFLMLAGLLLWYYCFMCVYFLMWSDISVLFSNQEQRPTARKSRNNTLDSVKQLDYFLYISVLFLQPVYFLFSRATAHSRNTAEPKRVDQWQPTMCTSPVIFC